jgi:hypothetical protein
MDMEMIKKLLEALELPTKTILGLAIASLILLLVPPTLLAVLGLDKLVDEYRSVVGFVFIISTSLLVSVGLCNLSNPLREWFQTQQEKRESSNKAKKIISELDNPERATLYKFLQGRGFNTVELKRSDPTVSGLVFRGILEIVGEDIRAEYGYPAEFFPMRINPEIRRHLSLKTLGLPPPAATVGPPQIKPPKTK